MTDPWDFSSIDHGPWAERNQRTCPHTTIVVVYTRSWRHLWRRRYWRRCWDCDLRESVPAGTVA
jgi:hypothetical protein